MRKANVFLRILATVIDIIIIIVPIQFIMMGVFGVSMRQAEFFFQILFAVYGTLLIEYWGLTLGKYFAKLKVVDASGTKPTLMYVGLRELTKSMYFIPWIGWFLGVASGIMMLVRQDGRTLHDFIGKTRVIYQADQGEIK